MAVVQLTGKEGGGVCGGDPLTSAGATCPTCCRRWSRSRSIGFLVLCCMLFGLLHWIPGLGDFWDGIFWCLPLLAGLVMALLLVGLVGYPLMYTTLSAEGQRHVRRPEPVVQLRLPVPVALPLVLDRRDRVRGGGDVLRGLRRVAGGVPRQVGREQVPGLGDRPVAGLPVHLRPRVVRLAEAADRRQPGRRSTTCGEPVDPDRVRTRYTRRLRLVQRGRGRDGQLLGHAGVPDGDRVQLQLLLVGRDADLPADAEAGGRDRAGRGVPRGGEPGRPRRRRRPAPPAAADPDADGAAGRSRSMPRRCASRTCRRRRRRAAGDRPGAGDDAAGRYAAGRERAGDANEPSP